VYTKVPDSDESDVHDAVAAAAAAFPAWAATPAVERSRLMLRLADLIDERIEDLARAESIDTGKPISLARSVDIPRAAANLRFFATAILHTQSEMHEFDGGGTPGGQPAINYTLRRARGVAGLISPWNLPLYLLTWKIAPAIATGNTAVAKPSEVTPATAAMLGALVREAGLPPGVVNIVHGRGDVAGAALVRHPDVPTISFTGSTAVGRWIGETCGQMLKRVSLELGGKNPFVVFEDADFETSVATAVRAAFTNQGQICLCGSRLLVHESVFGRFREEVVARVRALKLGDPTEPGTQQGALVSRPHLEKVDSFVRLARELGGVVHCGGATVPADALPERCRGGFFYQPTVISGLEPGCRVEQEEIFGPVVTLQPFRDEDQAVAMANCTPYGLAATVFTRDLARAHRVADRLQAGIVWVNCWMVRDLRTPFGGVKQSGVGREGGVEALRFFTESRNVCVRL
jgi:aminomuconate-semialdehyde/2-hydroxymuconate-6-semialdehyde dehydrogenase